MSAEVFFLIYLFVGLISVSCPLEFDLWAFWQNKVSCLRTERQSNLLYVITVSAESDFSVQIKISSYSETQKHQMTV